MEARITEQNKQISQLFKTAETYQKRMQIQNDQRDRRNNNSRTPERLSELIKEVQSIAIKSSKDRGHEITAKDFGAIKEIIRQKKLTKDQTQTIEKLLTSLKLE